MTAQDVTVREVDWVKDEPGLLAIPTEWTADRIYEVKRGDLSFELNEQALGFSYEKDGQPLAARLDSLKSARQVLIAERESELVGVAGLYLSEWNFRPSIGNLRVAPEQRRTGVGSALVTGLLGAAKELGARGLWLEVTNVNVPAINLYRSLGFRLCGLDDAMYMRWGLGGETALFFLHEF